jgi:GTP-binding protein
MFIDEVSVYIEAGKGGDGCTSFRREKYIEMGGPNGGNGGKGASIIFRTDSGLKTLIDLKMAKKIKGEKGENGKGSTRNGSNAKDVIVKIPCGTTIINTETGDVLADLVRPGEEVVIAKGGRGGLGNWSLASHENPAPHFSELGEPGEQVRIKCELKVIADVGLVGMPSVGKSTIINAVSNAGAKVGAYHFTTLNPNLGYVKLDEDRSFVMADLPGLIEGASEGIGLGHKFLKHALRTKVIAHVIDIGSSEGRDPIEDYTIIREELEKYDKRLTDKPNIVIANKMDLPDAEENLKKFKEKFKDVEVFPISALNLEGFEPLVEKLADMVKELDQVELYNNEELKSHILFKYSAEKPFTVKRDGNVWVLKGREIEKLFAMTRFTEEEAVERFGRKLKGMGVDAELEAAGAKRGDEVKILDYIFIFKD